MGVRVAADAVADPDPVEVWSCNAAALDLFLSARTQWRWTPAGSSIVWLGLDYPGLDVLLRRMGHDGDAVFADVRVMERAALAVLNAGD